VKLISQNKSKSDLRFEVRAVAALGISIVADGLDYVGAPIFALPIIGDLADGLVMTTLYRLTGSKTSAAINLIEFIPFIGDMVPTYTISTLLWIARELRRSRKDVSVRLIPRMRKQPKRRLDSLVDDAKIIDANDRKGIKTRLLRAYLILRSRMR